MLLKALSDCVFIHNPGYLKMRFMSKFRYFIILFWMLRNLLMVRACCYLMKKIIKDCLFIHFNAASKAIAYAWKNPISRNYFIFTISAIVNVVRDLMLWREYICKCKRSQQCRPCVDNSAKLISFLIKWQKLFNAKYLESK